MPRRAFRELLVFAGFLLLAGAMYWPWPLHLRDGVSDPGDPYLTSWILWWDWHGTFTQPFHLFDGNIFYPYKYSLAFAENCYGISLLFFPLFFLGLKPLTIHGLALFVGFALSGYGAFRLTRTLTGSMGAAWVAGIGFAFVPYRFHLTPHVNYLFAGWIPLLLEALFLFMRKRTWKRAAWMGVAFLMNGLSVIHWMVLSLVPLAVTGILLMLRDGTEKDRDLWKRGAIALGAATLMLLPFLLPYRSAAKLYGFSRGADEAAAYSAHPRDWLTADPAIRVWSDFGERPHIGERALFPGLTLLVLAALALVLARPEDEVPAAEEPRDRRRKWTVFLDVVAFVAGMIALLSSSASGFKLRVLGRDVLTSSSPQRALAIFGIAFLVRCSLAWPGWLALPKRANLLESLRSQRRPEIVWIGAAWAVLGFFGSLGMRTPFHRTLYELFPLFRGIRVPARWAMLADLGLALLAGYAALLLYRKLRVTRRAAMAGMVVFGGLSAAMLWESHIAPYNVWRGDVDPDEVTLRLKATPMKGGIVELPTEGERGNYLFVLRAADHGKPLVNGTSGFMPPIPENLALLTKARPIPTERLLDLLESVPVSYVVVRESWLGPEDRRALHAALGSGLGSQRLRFIRRFDGGARNDLYAVVKTEPGALSEMACPWQALKEINASPRLRDDPELTGSIDVPAERSTVSGPLTLLGWARVPGQDLDVTVLIDGELREAASRRRVARPDVARAVPSLGDCAGAGWEERYAFQPGDEGPHEIQVLFHDGKGHVRPYPVRRFTWKP